VPGGSEVEGSERMNILLMVTAEGFYPVYALHSPSLQQQAKDHGELNDRVIRVEDFNGNILWERDHGIRH
jgi:hypothetical protein